MSASDAPTGRTALRIVAVLKQRIARWQLPDGHRLTEEALADEFGVSRSPVREALRLLASDGYVDGVPNAGYRVSQPSIEQIEDLYEFRLALEEFVVTKLATRATQGDPSDALRDLGMAQIDSESLAVVDRAFHEGLARAAGNDAIMSALIEVNDRLMVFREMEAEISGRPEQTLQQHQAVLDAVAAGDKTAAVEAVRINILGALDNVEQLLGTALVRGLRTAEQSSIDAGKANS